MAKSNEIIKKFFKIFKAVWKTIAFRILYDKDLLWILNCIAINLSCFLYQKIYFEWDFVNLLVYCKDVNPCLNNGVCSTTERDYTCQCKYGYGGENCEIG